MTFLLQSRRAKDRVRTLQQEQEKAEAAEARQAAEGANTEEIAIEDDADG